MSPHYFSGGGGGGVAARQHDAQHGEPVHRQRAR
eukprot:CAMPEP_0113706776 /NCGR_PEP_ID=MMETSP0038_2-20120614/27952_1 /TAXON_ID=2898 /ORGANISM="Cryptomonas paramecium" /LENGTH=33 /DNA_ID=CAMNT_0000632085 /DNA_START=655 /DNA_END=756 /DNA_ORIENTATION=- /assembly_acc=CAM_ASM_000170